MAQDTDKYIQANEIKIAHDVNLILRGSILCIENFSPTQMKIEASNINKHDSDTRATPKLIEKARHATAADARRKSKVDLKTVFLISKFIYFFALMRDE